MLNKMAAALCLRLQPHLISWTWLFPSLEGKHSWHDPLIMFAAVYAVVGLFIEISFIATFSASLGNSLLPGLEFWVITRSLELSTVLT